MAHASCMIGECLSVSMLVLCLSGSHCLGNEHADTTGDIPHIFRSFDENGEGRQLWLARFQSAKASCVWDQDVESLAYDYDWFPTDKFMKDSYWSYLISQMLITTYYPALPHWFVKMLHYFIGPTPHDGPRVQSHICRVADSEGNEMRIRRLGPFTSTGGFDWHKMKMNDPFKLLPHVSEESIHVTGFTATPVGEDGDILGNPPIHIHHANLGPNRGSCLSRLSQWHGDSQCLKSHGGTACYATALPPGFGFPVSEALRLDVDFNDVRPLQSPELKFWLEASISIAKSPTKQHQVRDVGTVILGVPFRGHWWKSSDLQRLYFVPSDKASVLWVTGRMPTAGTFVAGGKIEIHQHMLDEAWVFSGVSPKDLGLNLDAWQLKKPWLPWIPEENGWTNGTAAISALKSRVLGHAKQAAQLCHEKPACKKPPSLMWKLVPAPFEDGEERQLPWPEKTWTFEEGEQFTTVIFHKAVARGGHGHDYSIEMPQHLAITGHYVPKEGTQASYWFVLPSSDVNWAWINSVNWLHALTHHGGPPAELWSWPLAVLVLSCMVLVSTGTWCLRKVVVSKMLGNYSHCGVQCRRHHGYLSICKQMEPGNEIVEAYAENIPVAYVVGGKDHSDDLP